MLNTPPKISVITATWNCAATITDCLDSIAAQTYNNVEHIVIDGGSQDGTVALLDARRNQLAVLISEPDKGIYDALNKGIKYCSGDIVGFLHADDVYANNHVLAHIAEAFKDSSVQAVYGDLLYVQKQNTNQIVRYWKSSPFCKNELAWGWMPPHPTLYVRKKWYERIGGFDVQYRISADYYSILQLFKQPEFNSQYLPEVFIKMRVGGASNRSLKNILQKTREDLNAIKCSGVGNAFTIFLKNFNKIGQFIKHQRSAL